MKSFAVCDFKDVLVFLENKENQRAYDTLFEIHSFMKDVLHQESAHIMYYLAYCQELLGNPYSALDWLNRVLEIDSFNYYYASYRSSILSQIENSIDDLIPYGLEKNAEVEKIYNFLIKEGHVRSSLQFSMIRFYIKTNELETAKTMLTNFLERNPNDEEAKFMYSSLNSFGVSNNKVNMKTNIKCA